MILPFERTYCINLERRTDRKVEVVAEFAKHNINNVEFITGVDGTQLTQPTMRSQDGSIVSRGDIGCTLSHLRVVTLAKELKLKNYLVFEDDVELHPDFGALFSEYIGQLPINYDMLYFGGDHAHGGFQMMMPNIAKIYQTYTTHAIVVNNTAYDALLEVLSRANDKVDIGFASLHSKMNCYVFSPKLAFQRKSFSDILERDTDYINLR